jgi:hypothetical protein
MEKDFFFEVELVDAGTHNMVGVGLHPPGTITGMIGWEQGSFGYHADDGLIRNGTDAKPHSRKFAFLLIILRALLANIS